MLERLARWTYRNRWKTLLLWIVALVGIVFAGAKAGGPYERNFSLPGSDSQRALDLLKGQFRSRAGGTVDVVFEGDLRAHQATIQSTLGEIARLPHVATVVSPFSPEGSRQVSRDGTIAYAEVRFDIQAIDVKKDLAKRLLDFKVPGVQVEYGGDVVALAEQQKPGGAEVVGLIAALLILLFTFGSLLAVGLPLMSALFGIGIGLSLVLVFANFISVPEFTPQIAAMIGIGVGIDYALFIVTRYRQGLDEGLEPEAAVVRAMKTSGRAVVFAGTVVVISLLGILLMGFSFVQGIAVGGASAVFVTMLASITLLPAVLGFVGRNIDRLHVPFVRKHDHGAMGAGFWYRWSRFIQRRPAVAGVIGLGLLVALALPLFSMRLGSADAGNDPTTQTSRRAYDLLSKGFGPGFNGPLLVVVDNGRLLGNADVVALRDKLQSTPGVAFVSPPSSNGGRVSVFTLFPSTAPQDAATGALVKHLRSSVIPSVIGSSKVHVYVGGLSAVFVDFAAKIAQRLPILILVVIALSFLLLMAVFRSILVPIKAAIMNLLSIGAAYGVIVAVFQWGWLKGLIGVGKTGPIESWIPMMMFTILFGLSMDYEIFLLSRVREEYGRTHDNATSVADGVASTGRVITAAAAIMIAVFATFVIGFGIRQVKEIGLGLAVAVFVDVTLVRMILVPSTMELLGDANWWLPRWLGRALPTVRVEERELETV